MVVAIEDSGGGVTGNVEIGPSVVVIVERCDGEAVVALGVLESAGLADVFELSCTEVVIQNVRRALEAAGAAHDRNTLPDASRGLAGRWRVREVEVNVVGNGEIQLAVAVVVDEGTAGAPLLACSSDASLLGYLLECSIALVVEEAVFAVAGDVDVVESVVVIVSNAGPWPHPVETRPAFTVTSVKVPSWLL